MLAKTAAAAAAGPPHRPTPPLGTGGSRISTGSSRRPATCSQRGSGARRVACRAADSAAPPSPPAAALQVGRTVDEVCQQLDRILANAVDGSRAEQEAVQVAQAALAQGVFKAFGRGQQVPKRIYSIDELRLNKLEPEKLLSPTDVSLNTVRNIGQGAAAAGLAAIAFFAGFSKVLGALVAGTFLLGVDQVANMGGGEALLVDSLGRVVYPSYKQRVTLHEAGHFLVAYLVGLLPRDYALSGWDAFQRYRALNVQAGTHFCDGGFEGEVAAGRISSGSLDRYSCVALAGVVTEYLRFGQAEGGVGDVAQLDRLLRALQFTQKKADSQVRWSVLNVAALLRRHAGLHDRLAAAMAAGASVGRCIAVIEQELADSDLLAPPGAVAAAAAVSEVAQGGAPS